MPPPPRASLRAPGSCGAHQDALPDDADGRVVGVAVVVEGHAPRQQLEGHDARGPQVGCGGHLGRQHLRAGGQQGRGSLDEVSCVHLLWPWPQVQRPGPCHPRPSPLMPRQHPSPRAIAVDATSASRPQGPHPGPRVPIQAPGSQPGPRVPIQAPGSPPRPQGPHPGPRVPTSGAMYQGVPSNPRSVRGRQSGSNGTASPKSATDPGATSVRMRRHGRSTIGCVLSLPPWRQGGALLPPRCSCSAAASRVPRPATPRHAASAAHRWP